MANALLQDLAAATTLAGSDLFYVKQAGARGVKATGTQLLALVGTAYVPLAGGTMTGALTLPAGSASAPSLLFTGAGATTGIFATGATSLSISSSGVAVVMFNNSITRFRDSSSSDAILLEANTAFVGLGTANDVRFGRDAAATLALRNGTNQQSFSVYNTYTDSSNYERLKLTGVAGTSVNITAETLGTGGDNLDIVLTPAGTGRVIFPGGTMTGALTLPAGAVGTPSLLFTGAGATTGFYSAGSNDLSFAINGTKRGVFNVDGLTATGGLQTSNTDGFLRFGLSGTDIFLVRASATRLQVRTQGATAVALETYSLYTDASNYERLTLTGVAGTSVNITAESLGTGADNLDIVLTPAGTGSVVFPNSTYINSTGFGILSGIKCGTESSLNYYASGVRLLSSGEIAWTNTTLVNAPVDTALFRDSAGVVKVTDGGSNYRDLKLRNLINNPSKFAALVDAAAAGKGARAFINDGAGAVFGVAAAGGGALNVPVYSDGTNWIVG